MAKVQVSTTLHVPASAVWNMVGGFNALARWHPAIIGAEETTENGAAVRRLSLHGGCTVVERIESHDAKSRTYSYSIVCEALPAPGYEARLHVRESADGHSCRVEWSSEFEADGGSQNDAVKVIRGVYETGFENLRRLFGS